jgi:hypothetical protein
MIRDTHREVAALSRPRPRDVVEEVNDDERKTMNTVPVPPIDQNTPRKIRLANFFMGILIVGAGMQIASWVGVFDEANRKLLDDKCFVSLSQSEGASSEWIISRVNECAEFLEWGFVERVMLPIERFSFGGVLLMLLTFGAAIFQRRLLARLEKRTFGEWLTDPNRPRKFGPKTVPGGE